MNKYTKKSDFVETAEHILDHSDLLIKSDCVIVDEVLYERLGPSEYRFFFAVDDYDYLENEDKIKELDLIFGQ